MQRSWLVVRLITDWVRALGVVSVVLLFLVSACSSTAEAPITAGVPTRSTPAEAPTTTPPAEAPTSTTPTEAPTAPAPMPTASVPGPPPRLDLAGGKIVVFAPVPPRPADKPDDFPTPDGSDDYMALFEPGAAWTEASARVDAFKIHSWMIRHYLTDEELVTIYRSLNERGITLAIEAEPLDPPDPEECDHAESFEGPYEIENLRRLKALGIEVGIIAIEQPYSIAHKLDTPGACQYDLDRILREVIAWIAEARAIYPDVQVGSIEAIWSEPLTTPDDYALWLDSYEEASGEKFAFINIDPNFNWPGWADVALGIEQVAAERGVPFGVLYNGNIETTNNSYIDRIAREFTLYETVMGGSPDHVVIQSWHDLPDRLLPETDVNAFTHLVNRYFGAQAVFDGFDVGVSDGSTSVSGRLVSTDGEPLSGRIVDVQASRAGGVYTMIIDGTVPDGVADALIGIRMNEESTTIGDSQLTVHQVRYEESDDGVNLVPNFDFNGNPDLWGAYVSEGRQLGTKSVISTSLGSALRLEATPNQGVLLDGTPFAVTPGASFEFETTFQIIEGGEGTVTIAVIFLGAAGETARGTIVPAPQPIDDGWQIETGADGRFNADVSALEPGRYEFDVRTDGDVETWMAWTSAALEWE